MLCHVIKSSLYLFVIIYIFGPIFCLYIYVSFLPLTFSRLFQVINMYHCYWYLFILSIEHYTAHFFCIIWLRLNCVVTWLSNNCCQVCCFVFFLLLAVAIDFFLHFLIVKFFFSHSSSLLSHDYWYDLIW